MWCVGARGARGAVFRDACNERTARGAHGARGVCGAVFRDTVNLLVIVNCKHRQIYFKNSAQLENQP